MLVGLPNDKAFGVYIVDKIYEITKVCIPWKSEIIFLTHWEGLLLLKVIFITSLLVAAKCAAANWHNSLNPSEALCLKEMEFIPNEEVYFQLNSYKLISLHL